MKNFLILLCLISLPAYSLTLEGGVKTVEQAQKEVFFKPIWIIDPHPYQAYANSAPEGYRNDYDDGRYSIASGNKMYCYKNNKLYTIVIFDKNVFEYPRKSYRYDYPSGKLSSTAYGISEGNGYEFSPDGSLLGIWENGTYKEGDKTTAVVKTSYF